MADFNENIDITIAEKVAEHAVKKHLTDEQRIGLWRFATVFLSLVLVVGIVCTTMFGFRVVDELERNHEETIDFLEGIVIQTETITTEAVEAQAGGAATIGDNNTISMNGGVN